MKLEIVSPSTTLFSGEVSLVQLPGTDGLFEILQSHAPIVAVLQKGKVKIVDEQQQTRFFDINGGVVEASNDKILLLAES